MKYLKILMILYYYLYVALIAELFPSEMSPMKWSDLEALGWKKRRYDARTQRYSYVTPVRSSKTRIINRKSDLDPCDAKYAEILFPKISGKAGGNMRGSTEHVQVQEGVAILAEVEEAAGGAQASDGPANHGPAGQGFDMMEIATVVPGIKDHKSDLVKMAAKLKQFMVDHTGVKDFNIDKSVEELQDALDTRQHPFARIIIDHSRNFFEDVLEFAMDNTADLLYVIMRLTTTNQSLYDHKAVIQAATIYTQVATKINPSVNSALNEWLATTLQACGLTGPGLEILSTLGLTVGSRFFTSVICYELILISGQALIFNIRSVQKKKSELAYQDEQDVLTMATIATANFAYDNLNKVGASPVIVKILAHGGPRPLLYRKENGHFVPGDFGGRRTNGRTNGQLVF